MKKLEYNNDFIIAREDIKYIKLIKNYINLRKKIQTSRNLRILRREIGAQI